MLGDQAFNWSVLLSARQLTNACLLGLAVKHKGRFVAFDRGIAIKNAVPRASSKHLVLI
jgi:hypothetical protein